MVNVTHSADTSNSFNIPLKEFDSKIKDANLQFGFRPDGRLLSINTSVTGRAQETLESVASVVGSVFGLNLGGGQGLVPLVNLETGTRVSTICETINHGNDKKNSVANFIYDADLTLDDLLAGEKPLKASTATQLLNQRIEADLSAAALSTKPLITDVKVKATELEKNINNLRVLPKAYNNTPSDERGKALSYEKNSSVFPLELLSTRKFKINASRIFPDTRDALQSGEVDASATVTVAGKPKSGSGDATVLNQTYYVPIPKGGFFGTSGFTLALNDDGSITSISYSNTSGTASALNSLNSGLQNFQEPSDTEIANMIAAQSRRLRCEADPAACT